MSNIPQPPVKAPTVSTTGNGYQYVRCQRKNRDDTVYIHQLCAVAAGYDPHDVFGDEYDVHHDLSVPTCFGAPQIDTPDNVELVETVEHRVGELNRSDEFRSSEGLR